MAALLGKSGRLSKTEVRFAVNIFLESVKSGYCSPFKNSKLFHRKFSSEFDWCARHVHYDYRIVSDAVESQRSSSFIRNLLYPNTNDEVINQLKMCGTVDEVIKIIENNETLDQKQLNQVILTLRDLQQLNELQTLFDYIPARKDERLLCKLNEMPYFLKLLDLIEMNIDTMNANEISCCLLYLNKLKVDTSKTVVKKLIDAFEKKFSPSSTTNISLADLARVFITIKDYNNIWTLYTMNTYLPFLVDSLDTCQNYDDFRHITICFQKCVPLLTHYHLSKFTKKISMLLNEFPNGDESLRIRTILKCTTFLNFKHWNGFYVREVKSLISAMSGKLSHLSFQEIGVLHKIVLPVQEPIHLLHEIEEVTKSWMTTSAVECKSLIPLMVFQVTVPGMRFLSDEDIKIQLRKYLKKATLTNERISQFTGIHFLLFNTDLKFDKETTNVYWSALVDTMKSHDENETLENISWLTRKYMFFVCGKNSNRNESLETSLTSEIIHLLYNGHKFNYNPAYYSKFALTVLALHKNPFQFFTEVIWQKLLDYLPRLSIHDNLFVCLVLHVAAERFKKRQRNLPTFLRYYVHLISATNANTLNILRRNANIVPEKLNTMLFAHSLTEGIKTSEIFEEICERFKRVKIEELYSKIIRDSIYNFTICNHVVPEFVNLMIEYCIRESAVINGNTVSVVLNYCYMFGFFPERLDEFLSTATMLIERDKEHLPSVQYLRAAAALSYFGGFPPTWSDYIFNVEFLQRLDEQCNKLNFRNVGFLKKELMELNRILCMDYPSRDIPWFHEKYCQEQKILEHRTPSVFYLSVLNTLKSLVNVEEAIDTNYTSPYGHRIHFVIYLDENGNPTNPNLCEPAKIRRVAIVLKTGSSYGTYFNGKGKLELFLRQLEMLNYRVVLLNRQQWNSMYLSEHSAKVDLLRKLIWAA